MLEDNGRIHNEALLSAVRAPNTIHFPSGESSGVPPPNATVKANRHFAEMYECQRGESERDRSRCEPRDHSALLCGDGAGGTRRFFCDASEYRVMRGLCSRPDDVSSDSLRCL